MDWSADGRIAFVRDRSLWLADGNRENPRRVLEADSNPNVTIRSPVFSPDSKEIVFLKSTLGLRAEVWIVNLADGPANPVVADRNAENPTDVGWILDGRNIVYLTNRSGPWSLWHVDLIESTILPLTQPLMPLAMEPVGIGVWKDRIVVPRHFIDSDIAVSDGRAIIHTDHPEFEPTVSSDGRTHRLYGGA